MNSMVSYVASMSHPRQTELKNVLVDAGLIAENGGNVKAFFAEKQKAASGKLKKVYSALRKADAKDLDSGFSSLVELL